jgi:hypothetical protein
MLIDAHRSTAAIGMRRRAVISTAVLATHDLTRSEKCIHLILSQRMQGEITPRISETIRYKRMTSIKRDRRPSIVPKSCLQAEQ